MRKSAARGFRRRLANLGVATSVSMIGLVASLHAQTVGPLVRVTGPDPFAACTKDNVQQQETTYGSVLYPNTTIEPWVAADPTSTSRLLVGHQQDRWSDGGSRSVIDAVSNDAGASWTNPTPAQPPGVTQCTGGRDARASDPWTAFANDGTALFMSLVLNPAKPSTPFGARHSAMLVSRSADHAQTWGAPVTLLDNNSPHVLNDKNSMTADPTENGVVYAVWDQLSVFPQSEAGAALLGQNEGIPIARKLINATAGASAVCVPFNKPPCKGGAPFYKFNFAGPSIMAISANNGVSWAAPKAIYNPGTDAQTIDNLVQVTPNGNVYDFFTAINAPTPGAVDIGFVWSSNKGNSWSAPTLVTDIQVVGVVSPDSGQPLRDASILYALSANPVNGALYITWQDDRFTATACTTPTGTIPIDSVAFAQSLDGGQTWSKPIMINQTPVNAANPCRQQAFIPAVVASGDGKTVVVTYYDFRNDTNTPAGFEGTDYFAVFCATATDCSNAANWGNERRLTDASFSILDAPVARGHFLGDYMGLAASGPNTVHSVFGIATGPNVTAEFTRTISGLP